MVKRQQIDTSVLSFGLASWRGSPPAMNAPHRHNDIELNYLESGAVTYLFGGERVRLDAGDVCVFWAVRPHRLLLDDSASIMLWVTLPLSLFLYWRLPEAFSSPVLHGTPLVQPGDQAHANNQHVITHWHNDLAHGDAERQQIVRLELEAFLRRFALRAQTSQSPAMPERQTSSAEHMARVITDRYAEPLSVAEIAASVGLHPHYAMHVFRQAYGVSIISYLTQHRIAHAQQQLATSERGVLEIGMDAGFASASRFYSAFKQVCGVSPAAYRASLWS